MERPDFQEVLELLEATRGSLRNGNSYNELGQPLYDAAEAAVEGALNVLKAISRLEPGP